MHSLDNNTNIPTFILKLWKLVCDDESNNLIGWNRSGRSFIIKDQARFAKELLPLYFKHSNMASFIRQLNMYGFRKVSNIEHGGLKSDGDEVEFFHHCFMNGQENQLQFIKRKMSNNSKTVTSIVKVDEFQEILTDVESIKGRQDSVDTLLDNMKQENEALWREIAILRQKHLKQQQIVEKLLQFLISIVRNRVVGGIKRKAPLMIDSTSGNNRKIMKPNPVDQVCMAPSPGTSGPIIHDITDLEESDLLPLIDNSNTNSMINTMPIMFDSKEKAVQPDSNPSLESVDPNVNQQISLIPVDSNSLVTMNQLPSEVLQLDNENLNLSEDILNTDISSTSSGLCTPTVNYVDSMPSSSGLVPSKQIKQEPSSSGITDLVVSNQNKATTNPALARLTSETFNDHVEGIDAELNWLQDQLYGGGLNLDSNAILGLFSSDNQLLNNDVLEQTTSDSLPKAIMDNQEDLNSKNIKCEDSSNSELLDSFDLNNITSDKDILSDCIFSSDIDPSNFN